MSRDIDKTLKKNKKLILEGTVLAIDPSSGGTSLPGYAFFRAGELEACGELELDPQDIIQERLNTLFFEIASGFPEVDVLAIERIRGRRAHEYLKWSVGVAIAAANPRVMIEVPPALWHKLVPKNYEKTDASDAHWIGITVVEGARSL